MRDIEDLLAERGIVVSHESVRGWCMTFGLDYARALRRREGNLGDIWHLDEAVLVKIGGADSTEQFLRIIGTKPVEFSTVGGGIR